ncbi:hypothetical protein [Fluviicola taffensis]|uniref:Uncharacterized protein n=1 Tax=Fluviicola taffensis (strain DSM 16823 / NCIMB 13979 / RW262) TaxID=755732 RepID=F2IHJ5_FLUTR|nr:hypothetical protein [Fluviicola taffensis]AEA43760.1 hypothetical protein Fluta_1769 [Fluviicola taffensis DSM 16823]
METVSPGFQFEIRYSPILNFKDVAHTIISPFVPLATNLGLGNEGTKEERYLLEFNKENYKLTVAWDRIVLRFEGDITTLGNSNSVIEEPFLHLFSKIKEMEEFGKVNDVLLYCILVKEIDKTPSEIYSNFVDKYFTSSAKNILGNANDSAIVFERENGNDTVNDDVRITTGPYNGLEDLETRKFIPNFLSTDLFKNPGEMIEIKILRSVSKVNFTLFKELLSETLSYKNTLWGTL